MKDRSSLLLIVIGWVVRSFRTRAATARALRMDKTEACIACGSDDVIVAMGRRLCMSCDYEGDDDGGGALSAEELGAMYESDPIERGIFQ